MIETLFDAPSDYGTRPPTPPTDYDRRRWELTRSMRQMMQGRWGHLIMQRLGVRIGNVRREAWKLPDQSRNAFKTTWKGLSVLYTSPPSVVHTDPAAAPYIDPQSGALAQSGFWALMDGEVQHMTLALREMWVRVDVDDAGMPYHRSVTPDYVLATPDPERPHRPLVIEEARWRRNPRTKRWEWTWEVLDISNADMPIYAVFAPDKERTDVSGDYFPKHGKAIVGDAYPYRRSDGTPIIPGSMYHAKRTGEMWNADNNLELYVGSLDSAGHYTGFNHVLYQCAYQQRYTIGLRPKGVVSTGTSDANAKQEVVSDPAKLLEFEPVPDFEGQPSVGAFPTPVDPVVYSTAAGTYARGLVAHTDIPPADVHRMSGDPRSGYAIGINRDGQRNQQRRQAPQFQPSDLEVIADGAVLHNRKMEDLGRPGEMWPEDGYGLTYTAIPKSPEEIKAEDQHDREMLDMGQTNPVDIYLRRHPGVTEEQAMAALERNTRLNAAYTRR